MSDYICHYDIDSSEECFGEVYEEVRIIGGVTRIFFVCETCGDEWEGAMMNRVCEAIEADRGDELAMGF